MQRNCHEFIAYENLVGASRPARAERGTKPAAGAHQSDIAKALPLVKRALKVLSEREVTPQLGLLKSTLLQLDSTFSEREYGAGSFRDFMEKVAKAGAVTLKHSGRSLLVEPVEDGGSPVEPAEPAPTVVEKVLEKVVEKAVEDDEEMPVSELGNAEGVRAVQQALSSGTPRWPMYIRQAKQFLKGAIENFDERRYGFASVVDLLRAAAKTGVVRIERDRQGGMRVFPGVNLKPAVAPASAVAEPETLDVTEVVGEAAPATVGEPVTDIAAEPPIVDAEISESPTSAEAETIDVTEVPGSKTRRRGGRAAKTAKVPKTREPKAAKPARSPQV